VRRIVAKGLLIVSLGIPFACGERGYGAFPEGGSCQGVAWGGWNGTPQCAGIGSIVIAADHRGCTTNEDCALVGVTACSAHAVRRDALATYAQQPAPCTHPLSGVCPARQWAAACEQGCCVPR